jgi:hypothetical protein
VESASYVLQAIRASWNLLREAEKGTFRTFIILTHPSVADRAAVASFRGPGVLPSASPTRPRQMGGHGSRSSAAPATPPQIGVHCSAVRALLSSRNDSDMPPPFLRVVPASREENSTAKQADISGGETDDLLLSKKSCLTDPSFVSFTRFVVVHGSPAILRPIHSALRNTRNSASVPHSCQSLRSIGISRFTDAAASASPSSATFSGG